MTTTHALLARYLHTLPAGFPPTESGLELQLLEKLFSEDEARIALHLNLLGDDAASIANKAEMTIEAAAKLLEQMVQKGLISVSRSESKQPNYSISQFVVGIFEGQVNRLDKETAALFEAYAPIWWEKTAWQKAPQLRTIPVMKTIPVTSEVLPYEQIEQILRSKKQIAVRNCICRQEQELLGKGCGKPMETCLSFDDTAEETVRSGKGRWITLDEALDIISEAQAAGLVLQPANSQNPIFLCACCSCCCGILRHIKKEPNPRDFVANPFIAYHEADLCIGCEACVEICPMNAVTADTEGTILFDPVRCIGCGLCVGVCPTSAMQLVRKTENEQPKIPKNTLWTYMNITFARGLKRTSSLLWNILTAWISRLRIQNLFEKHT